MSHLGRCFFTFNLLLGSVLILFVPLSIFCVYLVMNLTISSGTLNIFITVYYLFLWDRVIKLFWTLSISWLHFFFFYSFESFSHNLGDSKSPQVSRTLLSMLVDLNNAIVCMVSTRPLIPKSSSAYMNTLVTVPSLPITIGITVTFWFDSFFLFSCNVFSFSFCLTQLSAGTAKYTIR